MPFSYCSTTKSRLTRLLPTRTAPPSSTRSGGDSARRDSPFAKFVIGHLGKPFSVTGLVPSAVPRSNSLRASRLQGEPLGSGALVDQRRSRLQIRCTLCGLCEPRLRHESLHPAPPGSCSIA